MTKNIYIGRGIYSVAEAARLSKVSRQRIEYWMFRDAENPVLEPEYAPVNNQKALSFHDLIEILIGNELRVLGISLEHIRNAHSYLKGSLNTEHPFCHQEVKTDGKNIFIEAFNKDDEMLYQELLSGQHSSPAVIEQYVKNIDYDSVSKLATRWHIHEGIVVDPAVSFGSPVIQDTRISSYIISDEYNANAQNAALIADLYNITEQDVMNAVEFEGQLNGSFAA